MPVCPYCGEPQNALKNHVRLSSGNGHGPSGQYPDDFDGGTGTDSTGEQSGAVGLSTGSRTERDESLSGTQETAETGTTSPSADHSGDPTGSPKYTYEDGLEHGYDAGHTDGVREATEATPDNPCPECGYEMHKVGDQNGGYIVTKGRILSRVIDMFPKDHICYRCDILEQAGTFYYGHESKEPGKWVSVSSVD